MATRLEIRIDASDGPPNARPPARLLGKAIRAVAATNRPTPTPHQAPAAGFETLYLTTAAARPCRRRSPTPSRPPPRRPRPATTSQWMLPGGSASCTHQPLLLGALAQAWFDAAVCEGEVRVDADDGPGRLWRDVAVAAPVCGASRWPRRTPPRSLRPIRFFHPIRVSRLRLFPALSLSLSLSLAPPRLRTPSPRSWSKLSP